jgi:hypothetical protein
LSEGFHTLHVAEDNDQSSSNEDIVFESRPKEEEEKVKLNDERWPFKIEGYLQKDRTRGESYK